MTLDELATGLPVSTINSGNNSNLAFIRINNKNGNPYTEIQKHLYLLSHQLKEKFSNEIVFISFDKDTIVILFRDNASKQKVITYLDNIEDI